MGITLLLIYMCTIYLGFCHVITDEDYALLPPLYEMDNYTNCKLQKNAYCQVSFTLKPLQNSKTWELIQISKKEKFMFSREVIHRAVCIPGDYEGFEDRKAFVESKINEKLKPLYLSTKADDIVCSVKPSFNLPPSSIGILLYILFVVIATMVDHNYKMSSNDIIGKVTKHFSLARNFRKIFRTPSTSDYQRLKCIQGIRTLTCTGIIVIHSKVSHFLTNHEVKREFEELYSIHYYLFIFDYFVIQIFLVISPWLLTLAVLNLYERNGHFTVKDAVVMFVNRCFRFWPVLIAIIFVLRNSNNFSQVSDVTAPKLLAISDSACRNNWMATIFFYQNFYLIEDTCANGTWYVSADVQLYALSLIILFLTLKTKSTAILKISLILSYVVFACVIYFNDLDVVFRPYPG
ncbi:unnamed protein product [Acanthoscelides obtectus]|nr:unnamed protein product [Acanthoscelides obtectus]CAK1673959.1 hypothetical protein AOBTE_LOCUS29485 [Acanthoscelides obtectus]